MPSSEESSQRTIEGLIAAINAGDVDRILTFYDENITNHGRPVGHRGMRSVHEAIFTVFPDWRLDVDDLITTADRAVARGTLTGTHRAAAPEPWGERLFGGALVGVEPAGARVSVAAVHVWELSSQPLVTAHWAVRDDLSMYHQLRGRGR